MTASDFDRALLLLSLQDQTARPRRRRAPVSSVSWKGNAMLLDVISYAALRLLRRGGFAAPDHRRRACPDASPPVDLLKMFVPAAPGGGWDQTARTIEQVLRATQRREGRADHQCGRRRRHGRAAPVSQPVERAGQRADGRRHGDGRLDHRQQEPAAAVAGHADRAADRRVPCAGRSRAIAVQDRQGLRRRAQGRSYQGPGRRRLRRRFRPYPAGDDRQGARRRRRPR